MSLTVENGSGVPGADSYASASTVRTWAASRGLAVPETDAELEKMILKGMDYLEAKRAQFCGSKVSEVQPLQWPRMGAFRDGFPIAENIVPAEIVSALAQLCVEQYAGTDIFPTSDGRQVTREKVDVLEIEYSSAAGSGMPALRKVEAFLSPLMKGGGKGLFVVRA